MSKIDILSLYTFIIIVLPCTGGICQGTFNQVYSTGPRQTTVVRCDGMDASTWSGAETTFREVNAAGVPRPDVNYQGWFYRTWARDDAWEYWRFTANGEFEVHHFCTDLTDICRHESPNGSQNYCCNSLTAGATGCDGGNQYDTK